MSFNSQYSFPEDEPRQRDMSARPGQSVAQYEPDVSGLRLPSSSSRPGMPSAPRRPHIPGMPSAPRRPDVMPMPTTPILPPTTAAPAFDETPTTVQSPYYTAGFLRNFIGRNMRVEFLIGTSGALVDRIGTLVEVGASYIVLSPLISDDLVMCDLYAIKFVTIYN